MAKAKEKAKADVNNITVYEKDEKIFMDIKGIEIPVEQIMKIINRKAEEKKAYDDATKDAEETMKLF